MSRKKRTDSISESVKVAQASFTNIEPPEHIELEEKYRIYFDNVIAEFAKSEWTNHQLEIVCVLARTICDLNEQQKSLNKEGYITERQNGTTVENPRMRVVKSLTGDILSLRRSLALHARAKSGDNRDAAKQKKGTLSGQLDDVDDLIARPN